jgi:cyclohexyl-isocyanide hydratase
MEDDGVLRFIRRQAVSSPLRYLTSVCTGALVLAATGLLQLQPPSSRGQVRATTHWLSKPLLAALGVEVGEGRAVWCDVTTQVERNDDGDAVSEASFTLVTGGGVTAGIDFALDLVRRLCGEASAQGIQLAMEYDPAPPTKFGAITAAVAEGQKAAAADLLERRWAAVERVRRRLGLGEEG